MVSRNRIVRVENAWHIKDIRILGERRMYIPRGISWTDPGYGCITITGEDCRNEVRVVGSVDTSRAGLYQIYYTVFVFGQPVTWTRNVYVVDAPNASSGSIILIGSNPYIKIRGSHNTSWQYMCLTSTGADCYSDVRKVRDIP